MFWILNALSFTKADGSRVQDEENKGAHTGDAKAYNNVYEWVEIFSSTRNDESWGLSETTIDFENF